MGWALSLGAGDAECKARVLTDVSSGSTASFESEWLRAELPPKSLNPTFFLDFLSPLEKSGQRLQPKVGEYLKDAEFTQGMCFPQLSELQTRLWRLSWRVLTRLG